VKETIVLKNQTDRDPKEEPIPLTCWGKTSEIINHPKGPILIA